jgi:hypothetical protein
LRRRLDLGDHRLRRLGVVAVAHVGGVEAEVAQRLLEVALAPSSTSRSNAKKRRSALDRRRVLGPDRPAARVARVDQRLVGCSAL